MNTKIPDSVTLKSEQILWIEHFHISNKSKHNVSTDKQKYHLQAIPEYYYLNMENWLGQSVITIGI